MVSSESEPSNTFEDSAFFTEFERFDRHIDKLRRAGNRDKVDYVSICSPNYLHDSHIRFALRSDADAICEKPLVLNPWNIDGLVEAESASGRKVSTVLQLRVHPAIANLRERVRCEDGRKHDVDLTYITARGRWYAYSWKGDEKKSGGIATNIGVHFFDMLHYIFGALKDSKVHVAEPQRAAAAWRLHADDAVDLLLIELPEARGSRLRTLDMAKPPGVAETLDWTEALVALGAKELDEALIEATMGSVLKYHEDQQRVLVQSLNLLAGS